MSGSPAILTALVAALLATSTPIASGVDRPQSAQASKPIAFFIADGAGKAGFTPSDPELARWALDAWARSVDGRILFQPAAESSALFRLYWADPLEGQYGETRTITVGGQRGAEVFVRPDVNALGAGLALRTKADPLLRDSIVYLTCLHELGHALGLEHTRDFRDIMYFFGYGGDISQYFGRYRARISVRADIAKVSGLSQADIERARQVYMNGG